MPSLTHLFKLTLSRPLSSTLLFAQTYPIFSVLLIFHILKYLLQENVWRKVVLSPYFSATQVFFSTLHIRFIINMVIKFITECIHFACERITKIFLTFCFLSHRGVCTWLYSLLWLLTRHFRSNNSQPRNKSKVTPFSNGFRRTLVIKSGTTPRGDIAEEPGCIYKELHVKWHTSLCCIEVTIILLY